MAEQEKFNAVFPSRLRMLIKERDTTITALAKELGISRQAVSQYAEGIGQPNIDKLVLIAKYFNVSTDYLTGMTDYKRAESELLLAKDLGLSEDAIQAILEIKDLEQRKDSEVTPLFALDRIVKDPVFKDMTIEAAALVGKGSRDLYRNVDEPGELTKTLLMIETLLKDRFKEDFYIAYGMEVRDRYVGNAALCLENILEEMYFEIEAKKDKPIEDRTIAEIRKVAKDQPQIVDLVKSCFEDDADFIKFYFEDDQ